MQAVISGGHYKSYMMNIILKFHSLMLALVINHLAVGQPNANSFLLREPQRFIDRVEIFAGAGFCFNYGNRFIENYRDDNIQNERLLKIGYSFGVALYHPVSDKISVHARASFDQKGTRARLNLPVYMGRLEIESEYDYRYLTVALAPRVLLDNKKNVSLFVGGYYSVMKRVRGQETVYHSRDHTTTATAFRGRSFRKLDDNGGVITMTYVPGLRSFEKFDFGVILGIGYALNINETQSILIQLIDNAGLQSINTSTDYNRPEKNHLISLSLGYVFKR